MRIYNPDAAVSLGASKPATDGRFDLDYANPEITETAVLDQLAYYDSLQQQGHIHLIRKRADLETVWSDPNGPIGCILSMEGYDPMVEPIEVEK